MLKDHFFLVFKLTFPFVVRVYLYHIYSFMSSPPLPWKSANLFIVQLYISSIKNNTANGGRLKFGNVVSQAEEDSLFDFK